MDAKTALERCSERVEEPLTWIQRQIFLAAWEGQTYNQMVEAWTEHGDRAYDESYIRDEGRKLCKCLGRALGVAIEKRHFRETVTTGLQSSNSLNPSLLPALAHPG